MWKSKKKHDPKKRSPSNCFLNARKDAVPTRTNTHPTQVIRPLTATTMVLMPPNTLPPVAASFSPCPTASTRVDTTSQGEAAVLLSDATMSSSASSLPDHEEGLPVPTHALTCLTTFSFLFSPFLGPKDCLTMTGLQKVRKEAQGIGRLKSVAEPKNRGVCGQYNMHYHVILVISCLQPICTLQSSILPSLPPLFPPSSLPQMPSLWPTTGSASLHSRWVRLTPSITMAACVVLSDACHNCAI